MGITVATRYNERKESVIHIWLKMFQEKGSDRSLLNKFLVTSLGGNGDSRSCF